MEPLPQETPLEDVALYYKPSCPFCRKVLDFLEKENVQITLKNIFEGSNKEDLIALTGKGQVPCLVAGKKFMHESDEVVAWLKKKTK